MLKSMKKTNLSQFINQIRGKLTVISVQNRSLICKCSCDNKVGIFGRWHDIINNKVKSCGCLRKETGQQLIKNLIGQKFDKLYVIKRAEVVRGNGAYWLCKCDCGNEKIIKAKWLLRGTTKSCGCAKFLKGKENRKYRHDISDDERLLVRNTPEYKEWAFKIKERDYFICQICKDNKGGNLVSHHFVNYSQNNGLRYKLENGITTLCVNCHKIFHSKYGMKNNTKEQFEEFRKDFNVSNK